ncbi:hypothetical protein H5410_041474, partial [Solanum commersonii]
MSCDIITNIKQKVVLEDQVYKDKGTLKVVMTHVRSTTNNLIGGMIKPKLVDHKRKLTPKDIQQDVSLDLGVDVSYAVAWKAKENDVISLRGTPSRSYSKLSSYLYILDTTYPGSHIRMKETDENQFLPIVVVDGSHLRGTYNGTFMSASTIDGA